LGGHVFVQIRLVSILFSHPAEGVLAHIHLRRYSTPMFCVWGKKHDSRMLLYVCDVCVFEYILGGHLLVEV